MRHIWQDTTDPEVLQLLGARLRGLRKAASMTIEEAADTAGLGARTVARAEKGDGPTLLTVIRLLRAYGRLDALDLFIPEPEISPMQIVRSMGGGAGRSGG